MAGTISDIDEERADREDTDPQIKLDRMELRSHRDRLALLERQGGEMLDLLRSIARKIGAELPAPPVPPEPTG